MNPLESRKQLLIAESELNRAQLVADLAALTAGVRAITDRARSFGSIASSAAVLVAGLAAFRRRYATGVFPANRVKWVDNFPGAVKILHIVPVPTPYED
jgi:hypothetical protein